MACALSTAAVVSVHSDRSSGAQERTTHTVQSVRALWARIKHRGVLASMCAVLVTFMDLAFAVLDIPTRTGFHQPSIRRFAMGALITVVLIMLLPKRVYEEAGL